MEFWEKHSHVLLDHNHVLQQCSSIGVYVKNSKHALEMIEVALFEEFQETNPSVDVIINMFDRFKKWHVSTNTIMTFVAVDIMSNFIIIMTHF